jgi:hypothetical protein
MDDRLLAHRAVCGAAVRPASTRAGPALSGTRGQARGNPNTRVTSRHKRSRVPQRQAYDLGQEHQAQLAALAI